MGTSRRRRTSSAKSSREARRTARGVQPKGARTGKRREVHQAVAGPSDATPVARGRQTAIDFSLRSLAEDRKEKAIGVIFSGTGSHGTAGIKEIKFVGGMVMVQDPATAEYDQMPRSAIATGLVDYVLAPEDM